MKKDARCTITVHTIWNKKLDDGIWCVKVQHELTTFYGYGDTLAGARQYVQDSLELAFRPEKFKVVL